MEPFIRQLKSNGALVWGSLYKLGIVPFLIREGLDWALNHAAALILLLPL